MNLARLALLALFVVMLCAPGGAFAQEDKWDKPWDLKPLVPPGFQLPPNSKLNSGTGGGLQTPNSSLPQQNLSTPSAPAPGIRLSIPTHED